MAWPHPMSCQNVDGLLALHLRSVRCLPSPVTRAHLARNVPLPERHRAARLSGDPSFQQGYSSSSGIGGCGSESTETIPAENLVLLSKKSDERPRHCHRSRGAPSNSRLTAAMSACVGRPASLPRRWIL